MTADATPLWQIFFSTLGGTTVGFALGLLATAYRERAQLAVRLQPPKERIYVTENQRPSGVWSYTVTEPQEAIELVLTVQLIIINSSASYDAITDVSLNLGASGVPARVRADEAFTGVNIPPRQSVAQRVRFFLPRAGDPSRDQVDVLVPDSLWDSSCHFEAMTLHWTSVRSSFLRRKPVSGAVEIVEPWHTAHVPGTEIQYLHRAPN
jgi:hypothetical protein